MKKYLLALLLVALPVCAQVPFQPTTYAMAGRNGSSFYGLSTNSSGNLITATGSGGGFAPLAYTPQTVLAAGLYTASVSVTASPFAYTVPAGGGVLAITGGTVSTVTLLRQGVTTSPAYTASLAVLAGDVVTVTYSAAPTMTLAQVIQISLDATGAVIVSGGGGGGINYPTGTGIPCVSGGAAWCTTYNASNLVPANYLPTGTSSTQGALLLGAAGGANVYLGYTPANCTAGTTGSDCLQLSGGLVPVGNIPTGIPIGNVGSAGLSGTAPITINSAGAIACATCATSTTAAPAQVTSTPSAGAVTYTDTTSVTTVFNEGQLSANVTSATTSGFVAGKYYLFRGQESGSTQFTKVWPANFLGFPAFSTNPPALAATWAVMGYYDGTNVTAVAATTTSGYGTCPTGTKPTTNPTGASFTFCDATTDVPSARLPNAQIEQMNLPMLYAADTASSGTTYTACPADFSTSTGYTTGMHIILYPNTASSGGATTVNLCTAGAKTIYRHDGTGNPTSRELLTGVGYPMTYNGTAFIMDAFNFPRPMFGSYAIASDTNATCTAAASPQYFTTTYTIPANELGIGSRVHIKPIWIQTNSTSSQGAIYGFVKVGSTVVAQLASALSAATSNLGQAMDVILTGTASPGASTVVNVEAMGFGNGNLVSSSPSLATNGTLQVSIGFSVAAATGTCSYTNEALTVERIN